MTIAWDIETCPIPLEHLSCVQQDRHDKLLRRQLGRRPEMDTEEASRLVRATHPALGWICCISLHDDQGDGRPPVSCYASSRKGEAAMLRFFWDNLPAARQWVTFNGKRFDVPFLRARSLHYGLVPTNGQLLQTHRYQHRPHCDLISFFDDMGLADVCDLLGVESPKNGLAGSGVAQAVEAGKIDEVVRYCEADVVATLACYQKAQPFIQ